MPNNKIWMVYFSKGELEKILTKANEILNPENLKISKAILFKHLAEFVMKHNVKLSNAELEIGLKQGREERFVIPRVEPHITLIEELKEYYKQKYGDYFNFVNKKIGVTAVVRLVFYEFMKIVEGGNEHE